MRRITLIITIALLAASCGGGNVVDATSPSGTTSDTGTTPASTTSSPSETPSEESPFPDGSYRSRRYSEADIRAVVPAKFEDALLENEFEESGVAITWTFEFTDGAYVWRYDVAGLEATGTDCDAPGTYTATEDTITFVDCGGVRVVADWKFAGDELHLTPVAVNTNPVNGVPWKWYVTYFMSAPFTKVA